MANEPNALDGAGPIHFANVRILDATGESPYTGEVLIQGNRIKQVTRGSSRLGVGSTSPIHGGATVIDGMGATLAGPTASSSPVTIRVGQSMSRWSARSACANA